MSSTPAASVTVSQVAFSSLDGLRLGGTFTEAANSRASAAVLVHGGGATRSEGGFFDRLATGLAEKGVSSLRFDLRGHGESEGRQQDLTLAGVANDIRSAVEWVCAAVDSSAAHLYGTSFGGGISAYYAARHPRSVRSLTLANPLLDYKKRFIDDKPYWSADHLSEEAARELTAHGFIAHSATFKLGRALLNEVMYFDPHEVLRNVQAPTLFIHGTRDTFISVESSRHAVNEIRGEADLIEVEGAQHGFVLHDDPEYREPQTREWQASVIRSIAGWITTHD